MLNKVLHLVWNLNFRFLVDRGSKSEMHVNRICKLENKIHRQTLISKTFIIKKNSGIRFLSKKMRFDIFTHICGIYQQISTYTKRMCVCICIGNEKKNWPTFFRKAAEKASWRKVKGCLNSIDSPVVWSRLH